MSTVSVAGDAEQETDGIIASIRRTFPEHIPLYACSALFCSAILGLAAFYRVPLAMDAGVAIAFATAVALFASFTALGLVIGGIGQLLDSFRAQSPHPLEDLRDWAGRQFLQGDRPGNAFHAIIALVPLLAGCDAVKEVITRIHPFSWDATFSQWDRVIGLGRPPWEWLQPFLGHPAITAGLNVFYEFWFLLILGSLLWEAFSPRRDAVRAQYLIAFALVWFVAGTVLAIVFSSAGPCYFGRLHLGYDPYAAQMTYLRDTARHWPLWSLDLQDALWNAYTGKAGAISGISAMPSIHVSASVLLALLGNRRGRVWGILFGLYAGLIFLGSIHLAWHYAVDGIAGAFLAVLLWKLAGIIVTADIRALRTGLAAVKRDVALPVSASIVRTFPDHIPIYVCAILFCGATLAATRIYHIQLEASAGLFFLGMVGQFLVLGLAGLALFEFVALVRAGCPDKPLSILANRIKMRLLSEDRPGNVFHALVALTPLMVSFTAMKDQIPAIHPFAWDKTFMEWDRWLGMGRLPWEILQPWLGHAWITAGINFFYDAWFLVMFCVLFSQAFSARNSVLRNQFLLAFAFAWFIGGNVLASIFSSAGPCFYGLLKIGPDPYAAQMAYLHATAAQWPVWSIGVQDTLWTSYIDGHGAVSGISAMPSMHVTVAVLLAIWGWRAHRWLGWSLSAFAALIVVGSIHLAWHYAVDGIAAIVLATLFWITAGAIIRATMRQHVARGGIPARVLPEASRA